ncbi:MAG: alpha/beta hydrolase [Acidimicrobiales bacterium]|nr:alpha/beta hydrolase [Acidimicrobiales bacterium]
MRPLRALAALVGLSSVAALGLTGCDPGTRYVDPVFSATTKSTWIYKTTTDLVTGRPISLRLDVYQPSGDTLEARPFIVWIHGGGFKNGDRGGGELFSTGYAQRGYVTASIDYRLDPGNKCLELRQGTIPPDQVEQESERCQRVVEAAADDARDAIRWLKLHASTFRLDTHRAVVAGGSAGALTALNVGQDSNPDHGDIPAGVKVEAVLAMSGCQNQADSIDSNDPPISILASGHDPLVPFACSVATVLKAKSVGTEALGIWYPDESAHASELYLDHRTEVDQQWTAWLVDQLDLAPAT